MMVVVVFFASISPSSYQPAHMIPQSPRGSGSRRLVIGGVDAAACAVRVAWRREVVLSSSLCLPAAHSSREGLVRGKGGE